MKSINETPIVHDRHLVKEIFERMKRNGTHKNAFHMPEDLTIVLVRNEGSLSDRIIPHLSGYEDSSILESNLDYLGIRGYEVLSKPIPPGKDQWVWTNKIKWILEYLNTGKCQTKYILYCDPIDVILKDSPTKIIEIFKEFDCEMLFMSTRLGSPSRYDIMTEIKKWADSDPYRNQRYLNAGVFIGETSFVKEFLEEANEYCTDDDCTIGNWYDHLKSNPSNFPVGASDQDIFRYLEYQYYPRVKVDYQNILAYRG